MIFLVPNVIIYWSQKTSGSEFPSVKNIKTIGSDTLLEKDAFLVSLLIIFSANICGMTLNESILNGNLCHSSVQVLRLS